MLFRRRTRSFLGYLALLPAMLVARFRNRRRQIVDDADLIGWAIPQPEHLALLAGEDEE